MTNSGSDCALCRVVAGTLDVQKLIETPTSIGFVPPVEALAPGHTVVFPKRHVTNLHDCADIELSELLVLVARLARAARLESYNVLQNNGRIAGQTVFHPHVHLIPKWSETDGLVVERRPRGPIDHTAIVQRIVTNLTSPQARE